MPVNSESIVKRSPDLMSTRVNNGIYILNPVRDKYTGMDDIGLRIWDLLEATTPVSSLCDRVVTEYQGDAQQIRADLMEFLNDLDSEGLLEIQ